MYKMIVQSIDGLKKLRKDAVEKREYSPLYNYFLVPFYAGMTGFASFLFILMIFDFITRLLGISEFSGFGITEVMIASLGFALQFIHELLRERKIRD